MSGVQLFLKYGGTNFWMGFIECFYERVAHCTCLQPLFAGKDYRRIKDMQFGLLQMALTGERCDSEVIEEVHHGMNISEEQFEMFLTIYEKALKEREVEEEDASYLLGLMKEYKDMIVEVGPREQH